MGNHHLVILISFLFLKKPETHFSCQKCLILFESLGLSATNVHLGPHPGASHARQRSNLGRGLAGGEQCHGGQWIWKLTQVSSWFVGRPFLAPKLAEYPHDIQPLSMGCTAKCPLNGNPPSGVQIQMIFPLYMPAHAFDP